MMASNRFRFKDGNIYFTDSGVVKKEFLRSLELDKNPVFGHNVVFKPKIGGKLFRNVPQSNYGYYKLDPNKRSDKFLIL